MFDPYYETKVNQRWGRLKIGAFIGWIQCLIGLFCIAFTVVDLASGMTIINGSSWQENSIWPTIGKGIWIGAIVS